MEENITTASHATDESSAATSFPNHKEPTPLFGHRFGLIDGIVVTLCSACIIATQFVCIPWINWALVALCLVGLVSPHVIQKAKISRQFGLNTIYRKFMKMGLSPVFDGNEIVWEFHGKKNAIRIHNECQVQIYREYPAPMEVIGKFESAASATMNEVFSAKVGIHREAGTPENIFFSTELLCSSMKEFDRVFAASVGILDAAEERQRVNVQELVSAEKKETRRIGFRY